MKWTDVVALLGLLVLIGFLGNGVISCARDTKVGSTVGVEESLPITKIDIRKDSLFDYGYVSISSSANVTLEYFDGDWWALEFNGSDFAIYQRLEAWLNKDYKYKITQRIIDNKGY